MYLWCTQVQWRYTNICIQNHFQFWSVNFIKENCQKNVLLALFFTGQRGDIDELIMNNGHRHSGKICPIRWCWRDETKQFRWMNRQLQWWYSSSSSRIMINEQIGKTLSSFFLFVLQGRNNLFQHFSSSCETAYSSLHSFIYSQPSLLNTARLPTSC